MTNQQTANATELKSTAAAAPSGFLDFLVGSLVKMANDPGNKNLYLPVFLAGIKLNNGQPLVPYNTEINMGPVPAMQSQASDILCDGGWAAYNGYDCATANTVPILNITSVTINGLNNASISGSQCYPADANLQYPVVFNIKMNAYNNYSKLTFNPATFYFDVGCQTCDKKNSADINATGTFLASVGAATLNMLILITLNSDLTATVTIPESYTLPGNIQMSGLSIAFDKNNGLAVSDVQLNGDNPLNPSTDELINQAFGDPGTIDQVQSTFNQNINNDNVRSPCAQAITGQLNNLLSSLK